MSQSCFYLESTVTEAGSQNAAWQDSGLVLAEGEVVSFNVTGAATGLYDPNVGLSAVGPNGAAFHLRNSLAPTLNAGGVIGRIGQGEAFLIGDYKQLNASAGGKLELGFNDSLATDNKGGYFVSITLGT